ncbi:DNA repair protein RadA [Candidatus Bathyarchaeota archaeon]|nr:DNA repair protein RadA [Candidatus Bathyarchaeota archaeon]
MGIYKCKNCGYESDSYFDPCPKCSEKQDRMLYEFLRDGKK